MTQTRDRPKRGKRKSAIARKKGGENGWVFSASSEASGFCPRAKAPARVGNALGRGVARLPTPQALRASVSGLSACHASTCRQLESWHCFVRLWARPGQARPALGALRGGRGEADLDQGLRPRQALGGAAPTKPAERKSVRHRASVRFGRRVGSDRIPPALEAVSQCRRQSVMVARPVGPARSGRRAGEARGRAVAPEQWRSSALQSQAERWTGNRGHGSPPTGRWGVDLSSRHRYGVKQNESLGRVRHLQASPRPCIPRPGAAALQRPKALPGRASLMRPAGSMVITVFFLFLFSFFCFYSSSGTPWCMRRGRFHYDSQQLAGDQQQQQRGQAQRVADGVSGWRRGQWRWPRPAPALGLASRSFAWLRVVPSRANTFFFLVPAEDALHTAEPSRVLPSGAEPSGADWGRAASPARPCRARPGH